MNYLSDVEKPHITKLLEETFVCGAVRNSHIGDYAESLIEALGCRCQAPSCAMPILYNKISLQ